MFLLLLQECLSNKCGSLVGSSCPYTPDAMLMSVVLFFGTFTISTALKSIKTSRYFPTKVLPLKYNVQMLLRLAVVKLTKSRV